MQGWDEEVRMRREGEDSGLLTRLLVRGRKGVVVFAVTLQTERLLLLLG